MSPKENPTRRPLSKREKELMGRAVAIALKPLDERGPLVEQVKAEPLSRIFMEALIVETIKAHRLAGRYTDRDYRDLKERLESILPGGESIASRLVQQAEDCVNAAAGVDASPTGYWWGDAEIHDLSNLEYALLTLGGSGHLPTDLAGILERLRIPVVQRQSDGREPHLDEEDLAHESRQETLRAMGLIGEDD